MTLRSTMKYFSFVSEYSTTSGWNVFLCSSLIEWPGRTWALNPRFQRFFWDRHYKLFADVPADYSAYTVVPLCVHPFWQDFFFTSWEMVTGALFLSCRRWLTQLCHLLKAIGVVSLVLAFMMTPSPSHLSWTLPSHYNEPFCLSPICPSIFFLSYCSFIILPIVGTHLSISRFILFFCLLCNH